MGMMEYVEEWVIDMRVRELSEGSIAVNRTLLLLSKSKQKQLFTVLQIDILFHNLKHHY